MTKIKSKRDAVTAILALKNGQFIRWYWGRGGMNHDTITRDQYGLCRDVYKSSGGWHNTSRIDLTPWAAARMVWENRREINEEIDAIIRLHQGR